MQTEHHMKDSCVSYWEKVKKLALGFQKQTTESVVLYSKCGSESQIRSTVMHLQSIIYHQNSGDTSLLRAIKTVMNGKVVWLCMNVRYCSVGYNLFGGCHAKAV